MENIYSCVDGSKFTDSVCKYGIFFAKEAKIPLVFLNTVEHRHISKKQDFSGNIGLGARDDLLEELSKEEESESKSAIAKGKALLQSLKEKVDPNISVSTKQRHGTLYENLTDLENEIRLLIIGLKGEDSQQNNLAIGEQVETIIRSLHVPTLLVNSEYKKIASVLIAYDGSTSSKKALKMVAESPMLGDITRYVINVNKDAEKSKLILDQAQEIVKDSKIDIETVSRSGDALEEITRFQLEKNIDLIAMGAFSHNKLRDVLFGSFTSKMLAKAKASLLLLR